ncbi:hypothetical protein K490DRAFT_64165 [Saccharata proteae CBS 121410]|uniref:RNA polymerase Rpb4/RPC9 core domain-containing protein n=1 Tax=Saccharata proteae CBS 121410 TaxID=1314787 RepID=A0A6A5YBE1_9PEZI|nr:hypothetical protein K490DRAFT_64165 [Saccharata proteae CBS 121410]
MADMGGSSPTSPPLNTGPGPVGMALLRQLEPKHNLDLPTRRLGRNQQAAEFGNELNVGEDLKHSLPMTDTEAYHIINSILKARATHEQQTKPRHMARSEQEIRNKLLVQHKWDTYFSTRVKHETVEDAVEAESCCAAAGLSRLEGVYLTNLGCETAEEARTLVGPLEKVEDAELQALVDVLKNLRQKIPGEGNEGL